jgi:hypothetical protein
VTALQIVRGNPSDEEVAAVVIALRLMSVNAAPSPPPKRSAWSDRSALLRQPLDRLAWRSHR